MQQHLKYDSKAVEKKAKQVLVINRGTDTIILKFDRLGNRGVHSRRMKATINAIRMLFPKEAKDGTLRYNNMLVALTEAMNNATRKAEQFPVFIRLERHLGRLRASIKQQGEINAKVSEEMPPLVSDGRGGFTSDEHHRGIALIAKFSDGTLIIDTKSGRVCFECVVAENAMMEKNPLVEKPAG